jgi:SAM-dependent methyltransferase
MTRWPKTHLFGLDLSPARAGQARREGTPHVVVADIGRGLPLVPSTFDRVFCLETLEHLKRPEDCLREVGRLLGPGGRAILSVPNATGFAPFHRLGRLLPGRWLKGKLLPYEHPANTGQPIDTCFGFAEILALVGTAGLEIGAIHGWRYFRYLEMLPGTRRLYPWLGQTFERVMPRVGAVRFAYNLIMCCRVAGSAPV